MQTVTTIGLDIAKSVFQVHGVDAAGRVLIRRQLKRRTVLAICREAATMPGWHRGLRLRRTIGRAKTVQALGHTVRLMPPPYVKPYGSRSTYVI